MACPDREDIVGLPDYSIGGSYAVQYPDALDLGSISFEISSSVGGV